MSTCKSIITRANKMPLPKTETLKRRESQTTNGTVVFKEKDTDVEALEFIPSETFNDFLILAMVPTQATMIALPDSSTSNTEFGIVVGRNSGLDEHAAIEYGSMVEIIGRPLKTIANTGDITSSNFDLCLYRTSSIVRKVK